MMDASADFSFRRCVMMRVGTVGLLIAMCGLSAHADTIWSWTHEASGNGWANVLDGGPPVFDSEETMGLDDDWIGVAAVDLTQPGSLGASFASSSDSVIGIRGDVLHLRVELAVYYVPSHFAGGDRPGGEGKGELSSVIEIIAPSDQIEWNHRYDLDVESDFEGTSNVVVENVTQRQTLLTLTDESYSNETIMLPASTGDLIRITSEMSGNGMALPGTSAIGLYRPTFDSSFAVVPEPGSLVLLVGCVIVILRRGML